MSSKQHSRRTLFKTLAAGTVAVGLGVGLSGSAGAAATVPGGGRSRLVPVNRIGVQLFSLRDKVSSVGFRRVFEELSAIGYQQIEFAGYTQGAVGAITPAEIRTLLDDFGLTAGGSHTTLNLNNIDAQLDTAQTLGLTALGQGGAIAGTNDQTRTEANWLAAIDNWNQMGARAAARGITLYTHNHAGEFNPTVDTGKRPFDLMWDNLSGDVAFELDVYWSHVGEHLYPGFRSIDYVLKDPRRFPLLHLKDGKLNPASANGYDIIEFGAGDIDYQAFLGATRDRGRRVGMWEQDNAGSTAVAPHPIDSFGNADRSYAAISALRG